MIVRARAPLRLGLAGGGTDVSPYCDLHGGSVMNVTIDKYAYATIDASPDGLAHFIAQDAGACERILVLDEGRRSAGIGEGVITAIVEAGWGNKPLQRVVGDDTYTPLAAAANLILPTDDTVAAALLTLATAVID